MKENSLITLLIDCASRCSHFVIPIVLVNLFVACGAGQAGQADLPKSFEVVDQIGQEESEDITFVRNGIYAPLALPVVGRLVTRDGTLCTAFAVSSWRVVTAAHCLEGRQVRDMLYYVELSGQDEPYFFDKMAIHPGYNSDSAEYDVGVLISRRRIQHSGRASFLPMLSTQNAPAPGWDVQVMGYGKTSEFGASNSKYTSVMQVGALNAATLELIPSKRAPGTTLCSGDSGSPFMLSDGSGQRYVVGILSRGICKDNRAGYSLGSRTSHVGAWIFSVPLD